MADLTAAHRGYEYQDLMAACRLVDVVLGEVERVLVDEKLFVGDRFDDLTTVGAVGRRERIQFKHTDNDDKALTLATFIQDRRDLRLDRLVAAAATDRDGPGSGAVTAHFRIVLRDARPADDRLTAVLRSADPDPGPFQPGMETRRLMFDADALWDPPPSNDGKKSPFAFLREGDEPVTRVDLEWFCARLIVEVGAPPASWDLTSPGPAEALLLDRLRADIGAGVYPNQNRPAVDVADAFIRLARVARQRSADVTRDEILRRAQLRQDYGAVARAHPVESAVAVARQGPLAMIADAVEAATHNGGTVVLTAPPGHGKSWLCEQLVSSLEGDGWLVAEHYCYLGDADGDLLARVLAESLFGSLLARVADADPVAVAGQRPLLAADEQALVHAVARTLERDPSRPVVLVVDGLDHVTRVRRDGRGLDPSQAIAEALAALHLPAGSALVVLSQPGPHLGPLLEQQAKAIELPGLSRLELAALVAAQGIRMRVDGTGDDVLNAIEERSLGNALYATYLSRELKRNPTSAVDPAAVVRALPPFDGTLENYYGHLWDGMDDKSWWVAEVIALVDFAVTRQELQEIRPDLAHRVEPALTALKPVLVERSTQGGVRIYHESFGRYLRRDLQAHSGALAAVLNLIARWLGQLGLFDDPRAFRSLIPVLAQAERYAEASALVDADFVVRAVAAAMPVSAIRACLATAVTSAAKVGDWAAAVRCVELSRAAATLQDERYESTVVEFADVVSAVVGVDAVADRLLHDGRTVMAARAGLQMCAAVDQLGGVPPWHEYLTAHLAEVGQDKTSFGQDFDRAVDLAWLRGRLRLSAASGGPPPASGASPPAGPGPQDGVFTAPVDWVRLAEHYDDGALPDLLLVRALSDTYGDKAAAGFARLPQRSGPYCLTLAESVAAGTLTDSALSARAWARVAVARGLPAGTLDRLADVGVDPVDAGTAFRYDRDTLLSLTRAVQGNPVRSEEGLLESWLDQRFAAAFSDPVGLDAAEALLVGPGWYRCWLRFAIALARADTLTGVELDGALSRALELLTADLNPFAGEPRACDLYAIHGLIQDRVQRAISRIADPDAWERAIGVVRKVSDAVTTTLTGEIGGPLPPDWVMRLTIRTAPPSRLETVRSLAGAAIDESGGRRYYSDLAEARLDAARVALAVCDVPAATDLWQQACRLLIAYGWHKDITVFELLDPFPELIAADPARARQRLPELQAVCERVMMHTDGKETRHAPARWWTLIADADPAALAGLVAPALHARCNDPQDRLHDALASLWRACSATADPFVAAALRLAIEPPLDPADAACMGRLAAAAPDPDSADGRLLAACLARLDERPVEYSYSNSDELKAANNRIVATVNAAAQVAPGAPAVRPLPVLAAPPKRGDPLGRPAPAPPAAAATRIAALTRAAFLDGSVGLARAMREWQSRPYDDPHGWWEPDRAANVLGYRLLELAQDGQRAQVAGLLHQIADGSGYASDSELLAALAQGLSRHGENELAATAGALAWTRAPGQGGWLAFGGQTRLDDLQAAVAADPETALTTVAGAVAQAVRQGRGTLGISQALILAFVSGAAGPSLGADAAFACFDAAAQVIAARAPWAHASDDPELPYRPPSPDCGEQAPGSIDAALALATIAGITRPEREAKRRAMLATEFLVTERPGAAADGIRAALAHLSDPATLTWLLALLTDSSRADSSALSASTEVLNALATGPHLAVRTLARSLSPSAPSVAPPEPADPELLDGAPTGLWTPSPVRTEYDELAAGLVDDYAGARTTAAEPLLPGLTAAIVRRVAVAHMDDALRQRMQSQLRALADSNGDHARWPNAHLAVAEAVEDALQRAATGARSADLRHGTVGDPVPREAELAERIVDPPCLALALEAARRPRPDLPPPPSRYDQVWDTLVARTAGGGGTVSTQPLPTFDQLPDADGGWRVLASVETLVSSVPYGGNEPDLLALRFRGAEVTAHDERDDIQLVPPFGDGALEEWAWLPRGAVPAGWRFRGPTVGLDMRIGAGTDSRHGLGLPDLVVVPRPHLLVAVGATSSSGAFEVGDDDGPLLALRMWRTLYETSDYHQPWPRLTGAALVITERALGRVARFAPELVLRDFVDRRQC